MAFGTPPYSPRFAGDGVSASMGVVGTLGTADLGGTAQLLPFAVDPATGAQYVELLSGSITAASNPSSGTLSTLGTVGTILGIGGTVTVSGASAGTNVNIVTGTLQNSGSTTGVGTITNLGSVTNIGSIAAIGGTVTVTGASAGTNVNVVTGTVNSVGTILGIGGTVQVAGASAGTVVQIADQSTLGTITGSSQSVTGTLNGAGMVGINIGGTFIGTLGFQGAIDGATYIYLQANTATTGYSNTYGTTATGTGQYIVPSAGYQTLRLTSVAWTSGTAIITIHQSNAANLVYLATPQSPTVNVGNFGVGQFGNSDGVNAGITSAISWSGNLLFNRTTGTSWDRWSEPNGVTNTTGLGAGAVAAMGQDTGGTYHNLAVSTGGSIGTIILPNIPGGTINSVGSILGIGGTVTVSGASAGTNINIVTGTQQLLGTVQNINYGTIQIDPKPTPVKTVITSYGTLGTAGGSGFGTLVASVGAGTYAYITGYQIIVYSGTVDAAITNGTMGTLSGTNIITRGQFVPGGGIARDRTIPYVSGTAGTICYYLGGAGTAYFQVDYYAST